MSIFLVTAVAVVLTIIVGNIEYSRDPSTFFGAIFASWVAGLALFIGVGGLVAVVSLARPHQESFDARARILFRRQSGRHIDYIVSRISGVLEHYSEETYRRIMIKEFDENECKYLISMETTTTVRSYIDDIISNYVCPIRIIPKSQPPEGRKHKLVYTRIDGRAEGGSEEFDGDVDRKIATTIDGDKACKVEQCIEMWIKEKTEPCRNIPTRYTQKYLLFIENHLTNRSVNIKITEGMARENQEDWKQYSLSPGDKRALLQRVDLLPEQIVYDLRICSLDDGH
jgi:hypothetical protein